MFGNVSETYFWDDYSMAHFKGDLKSYGKFRRFGFVQRQEFTRIYVYIYICIYGNFNEENAKPMWILGE